MFADRAGFPVDKGGDGGDSINRAGQIACLTKVWAVDPALYCKANGFTRHPDQIPWNNPKNLSRDQIAPFISGLHCTESYKSTVMKLLVKAHLGGVLFAPNIERDYPGSIKRPYPHGFINDKGAYEVRSFDYADILTPDVYCLIKSFCSMSKPSIFGKIWNEVAIEALCKKDEEDDDDWNTLCQGIAYENREAILHYIKHRNWKRVVENYWLDTREDVYMASLWTNFLTQAVK